MSNLEVILRGRRNWLSGFAKCIPMILFAAFLTGCSVKNQQPSPNPGKDWTIPISWNFNFTNYVPCTTTVKTSCIASFSWGYVSGTTDTPLQSLVEPIPTCSGTITTGCSTGTGNLSFTAVTQSILPIGTVVFYVTANYFDENGVAGTVTATTGTTGNGPSVPVSVVAATNVTIGPLS